MHDDTKFLDFELLDQSWTEAYNNLLAEQPITCAKTGNKTLPTSVPKHLLFDVRLYCAMSEAPAAVS